MILGSGNHVTEGSLKEPTTFSSVINITVVWVTSWLRGDWTNLMANTGLVWWGLGVASEELLTGTQAQLGPDLQTVKTILKSGFLCETSQILELAGDSYIFLALWRPNQRVLRASLQPVDTLRLSSPHSHHSFPEWDWHSLFSKWGKMTFPGQPQGWRGPQQPHLETLLTLHSLFCNLHSLSTREFKKAAKKSLQWYQQY